MPKLARGHGEGRRKYKLANDTLFACRFAAPQVAAIRAYAEYNNVSFAEAVRMLCWLGFIAKERVYEDGHDPRRQSEGRDQSVSR